MYQISKYFVNPQAATLWRDELVHVNSVAISLTLFFWINKPLPFPNYLSRTCGYTGGGAAERFHAVTRVGSIFIAVSWQWAIDSLQNTPRDPCLQELPSSPLWNLIDWFTCLCKKDSTIVVVSNLQTLFITLITRCF